MATTPPRSPNGADNIRRSNHLGVITQGSLTGGLEMKLDTHHSVEDLRVGRFVVVEGKRSRFLACLWMSVWLLPIPLF